MKENSAKHDEAMELIEALCQDRITAEGLAQLEALVLADPAVRSLYVRYLHMHASLPLFVRHQADGLAHSSDEAAIMTELEAIAAASGIHRSPGEADSKAVPKSAEPPLRNSIMRQRVKSGSASAIITLFRRMTQVGGESPVAAALMWLVMAIVLSGTLLTAVFIGMMVFSPKPLVGRSDVARSGERGAERREPGAGSREKAVSPAQLSSPVARLVRMVDCRWKDGAAAPKAGDDLSSGRKLELETGVAELIFKSGARTVLEGPATLEIRSRMGVYLQHGKLTATIENPLAKGFEVRAPGMKYTDLGTEFGVSVAANGEQEVHVFRGNVQAEEVGDEQLAAADEKSGMRDDEQAPIPQSVPSAPRSDDSHPSSPVPHHGTVLSANQAIHVAAPDASGKPNKPMERMAANGKQFVRTGQFDQLAGERSPEFGRWKKVSDELCKRPDLLVYYDFQPDETDRKILRNRSASGKKLDGRIEGSKWTEGRLPGKQALEFAGRDDRVRVDIPNSLAAVTAVVWIRLDSLPNPYNSILMSDRWYERIGACHWQIVSDEGRVDFEPCPVEKISKDPPDFRTVVRSPSLARQDFKAWVQLAVVYDSTSQTTTFYKNGQEIGAEKLSQKIPLVFGSSQIANWEPYGSVNPANAARGLPARISELYLLSRALPAKEILRLYETAVPVPNDQKPTAQKETSEVRH
jgi:hypothetical protein